MNWDITSNIWLKFEIQTSCCRSAPTEHRPYVNCKVPLAMLNCYISRVSGAITQKSKFLNQENFTNRTLRSIPVSFETIFKDTQDSRQTVMQSLLSFNDTADHSPVLFLQLRGYGIGLQRGTGSGVDDVWMGLADDVNGSRRVVGREHKRALHPKQDSPSLYCMIGLFHSCHQFEYFSFRFWLVSISNREDYFSWADKSFRYLGHYRYGYSRPNI